MAKSKVLTAPYDPKTGSLLHHHSDGRHFSHYADPATGERLEREQIWERVAGPDGTFVERLLREFTLVYTEPDWRPNEVFHACLQIDSTRSGRSAKYVIWTPVAPGPDDRRTYPMFVTDLVEVLRAGVERGGIVCGRWIVAKRGQNYGLKVAR